MPAKTWAQRSARLTHSARRFIPGGHVSMPRLDAGRRLSVGRREVDALNYIDGKHVPAEEWLDNVDPAAGAAYGRVASSDAADVERAVAAARRAFPAWSATPVAQRSRVLRALARLIERDRDRLARAEAIDGGKPV